MHYINVHGLENSKYLVLYGIAMAQKSHVKNAVVNSCHFYMDFTKIK